ncbi:uncharacterized protein BX664DRAFT_285877 [Halteromyces radiatus]|uniref:uncharacterized protein n=1 Tax=Halteromyces radiatus TaxID=101107 RepID=UPI0022211A90|nr:uncharacterized protein BX664DRAFT_285877 [Halteromyces radiatus]KAI8081688.1 hypothetical protein BX664DRAFT_285877 [Halteromyces radiatus]
MKIRDLGQEIPGLILIDDFVTEKEEAELVDQVNQRPWSGLGQGPNPELKRRTQQYGHLFSYRYRKVLEEYGPLPSFIDPVVQRIMSHQLMPESPNHLLVNEYNEGQGIMPHIDAPALFGPAILSLSLLSACLMKFTHATTGHSIDVILPRRSMVVLTGNARYNYKHGISKDLVETALDGTIIQRAQRISFTFRQIIAWEVPPEADGCGCHSNKDDKKSID